MIRASMKNRTDIFPFSAPAPGAHLTSLGIVIVQDLDQGTTGPMSSTVWAVPAANIWRREADIFRFLKDARCSVRIVEVRLFRTGRLSDRMPEDRRRWQPGGDLTETAKEISKYITNSGSSEATIVVSDEL